MSCSWDVWCLDCEDGAGLDENHSPDLMLAIIRHVHAFAALAEAFDDLQADSHAVAYPTLRVRGDHAYVHPQWFAKHHTHRLVPRDEYGHCLDECEVRFRCCGCDRDDHCRLPKGHEGPHNRIRPDAR